MPIGNGEIAAMFDELADLLDIEDANPFRVRAYRTAAEAVRTYPKGIAELVAAGQPVPKLPGVGKDLADKIHTIVETGRLPLLDEVAERTPRALSDLMKIGGLGPKRVKTLYRELDIRSIDDLRKAAADHRIRDLPGFGEKTEQLILDGVGRLVEQGSRLKLSAAGAVADSLVAHLRAVDGVREIVVAGSFRRRKETVGDLDILATAADSGPLMDRFVAYPDVAEVMSKGDTRSTVRLRSGLTVDLRVVPQSSYGAALVYFTGSKAHNIAIREIGIRRGYKINEYGVFEDGRRLRAPTEAAVYRRIGLAWVPPELRENRGEIEAAAEGRLPKLVREEDLKGDLHCHTKDSDGRSSLLDMARAAAERGYEYLSVNDHTKRVRIANGLDEKRLLAQIRRIDALNEKLDGLVVLKSSEVDILEDGSLDLPDSVLKELDFTVCSVHYGLELPSRRQTERILRAMDNRYFTILGHPSGRRIGERDPYAVDLEKIMIAAKERGCVLEVSAHPDRLDLTDAGCRLAKELGVKLAISTDAHSAAAIGNIRFGVDQARRGWVTAHDVVNTRPLARLRRLLARP
ncbi:MAG: DNA polymerase/3'-5' exonuclease PolX [Gammaproteobacteria bacterium]|nr:DNA polymerase/3'-5' exonuclease PolX [Gammaproteobacteria bacterium]